MLVALVVGVDINLACVVLLDAFYWGDGLGYVRSIWDVCMCEFVWILMVSVLLSICSFCLWDVIYRCGFWCWGVSCECTSKFSFGGNRVWCGRAGVRVLLVMSCLVFESEMRARGGRGGCVVWY